MKRQSLVTAAVVVALSGALASCSGSVDEPKPSPSKTSAAASTAAPTTAAPVAQQLEGADGVTFDVQNWDEYAAVPAVLAWKQVQEGLAASTNQGKVLPTLRQGVSKKVLRKLAAAVDYSRRHEYHTPERGVARVDALKDEGRVVRMTTCLWAPSASVYDKDDKIVGGESEYWYRQQITVKSSSGRWIVTAQLTEGKCPGGPPA